MSEKVFYQLFAEGKMALFGGVKRFHSRNIYRTRAEAEAFLPEFTARRCAPQSEIDLLYLESVRNSGVVELVLEEE